MFFAIFLEVCSITACYKKAEAQQKLATTVTVVMLSVLSLALQCVFVVPVLAYSTLVGGCFQAKSYMECTCFLLMAGLNFHRPDFSCSR